MKNISKLLTFQLASLVGVCFLLNFVYGCTVYAPTTSGSISNSLSMGSDSIKSSSSDFESENVTPANGSKYFHVSKVGKMPSNFNDSIISNKLYLNGIVSGEGFFLFFTDDGKQSGVKKFSHDGKLTWSKTYNEIGKRENVSGRLILTSDSGFVICIDGSNYLKDDGLEVRINPVIIKCSKDGNISWLCEYKGFSDTAISKCFITAADEILTIGYTEVKSASSNSSSSKIYLSKLSSSGSLISEKFYGGLGFDMIFDAGYFEGKGLFALINSSASDGPFASFKEGTNSRSLVAFSKSLEIIWILKASENDSFDIPLVSAWGHFAFKSKLSGTGFQNDDHTLSKFDLSGNIINSIPLGKTSEVLFMTSYSKGLLALFSKNLYFIDGNLKITNKIPITFGVVLKVIEFGDYFLVISENITGTLPQPPYVSSIWHSLELVYSGYDFSGNLLWRDTYDNTPDFMKKYDPAKDTDWVIIG